MGERIVEHATQSAAMRIDRQRGVIYGVKLLGESSSNPPPRNNVYPRATREKARKLFEGARVYVDHPEQSKIGQTRPYGQSMGCVRNIKIADDGTYGDWHFPPAHPLAEAVLWDAEHNPTGLGFSINGSAGNIRHENGRRVVEEIAALESVDLVSRPATTSGLFEAQDKGATMKNLRELAQQVRPGNRYLARMLEELIEDVGAASGVSSEPAKTQRGNEATAGFRAAWLAIFDMDCDEGDKIAKARKLMRAMAMLKDDEEAQEHRTDRGGRQPSLTEVASVPTDPQALRRFLHDDEGGPRPVIVTPTRPTPRITETRSTRSASDIPSDPAAMARWLREDDAGVTIGGRAPKSAKTPARTTTSTTSKDDIPTDPAALARWLKA